MYLFRFNKKGNSKLGAIWSTAKLAGNMELFGCGCKGTCGEFCTGCFDSENPFSSPCYVLRSYRYPSVLKGHKRNTERMRDDMEGAFDDMRKQISRAKNKPVIIRGNESGELESGKELVNYFSLSDEFPNIKFYIYTKNMPAVYYALRVYGRMPANFFINISIWHSQNVEQFLELSAKYENIRAFVYDDGTIDERLKIDCHCPAYTKTGKAKKAKMNHEITCEKCGICFQNKAKVCACLDH